MYDIFRCAFDFDRKSGHLMSTTLNCSATVKASTGFKDAFRTENRTEKVS